MPATGFDGRHDSLKHWIRCCSRLYLRRCHCLRYSIPCNKRNVFLRFYIIAVRFWISHWVSQRLVGWVGGTGSLEQLHSRNDFWVIIEESTSADRMIPPSCEILRQFSEFVFGEVKRARGSEIFSNPEWGIKAWKTLSPL